MKRAMYDDLRAQEEKAEIIAELKAYIDNAFAVKFENAASPVINDLKRQIDGLFK